MLKDMKLIDDENSCVYLWFKEKYNLINDLIKVKFLRRCLCQKIITFMFSFPFKILSKPRREKYFRAHLLGK